MKKIWFELTLERQHETLRKMLDDPNIVVEKKIQYAMNASSANLSMMSTNYSLVGAIGLAVIYYMLTDNNVFSTIVEHTFIPILLVLSSLSFLFYMSSRMAYMMSTAAVTGMVIEKEMNDYKDKYLGLYKTGNSLGGTGGILLDVVFIAAIIALTIEQHFWPLVLAGLYAFLPLVLPKVRIDE